MSVSNRHSWDQMLVEISAMNFFSILVFQYSLFFSISFTLISVLNSKLTN